MIRNIRKVKTDTDFDFELFAPKDRIVFLDIETTGLKAGSSQLYLIGLCSYEKDGWNLTQYFAESAAEEMRLLNSLKEFLKEKVKGQDHLILITYNGDMFDLPYLRSVEKQYGLNGTLSQTVSFDLYKAVKPLKKITGLENLKLKTVEKYCGIDREDPYSGGELIYVYEEFLRLSGILPGGCEDNRLNEELKKKCLECLLLHNGEDLEDMLPTMNMLGIRYLLEGDFDMDSVQIQGEGTKTKVLDMKFRLRTKLPRELYLEDRYFVVSASGEDPLLFELCVPVQHDVCRMYFQNYKEYYYLPKDDTAIHKSVGEFVDKSNRVAATAKTCYIWEEADFIPAPTLDDRYGPLFYKTWKGDAFLAFTPEMFENEAAAKDYAKAALHALSSI